MKINKTGGDLVHKKSRIGTCRREKPVRDHDKLGVSPRVLYCVADTGYRLGRSLGDCRLALPKGRKYQMVKTQTESHVRRPIV